VDGVKLQEEEEDAVMEWRGEKKERDGVIFAK
jgi:hypothetical protein